MIVNGTDREMSGPVNVVELLRELEIDARGVAVALNGEIVRRSLWETTDISSSDVVEIVTAAAGG